MKTPDFDELSSAEFKEHRLMLERRQFFIDMLVPRVQLQTAEGMSLLCDETEHYRQMLVLELLGRKQEHRITYPADWWQHFKQRWFPAWALKRWPVRLAEQLVVATQLFPELAPPFRGRYQVITGIDRPRGRL